jgi:hypothetical protein
LSRFVKVRTSYSLGLRVQGAYLLRKMFEMKCGIPFRNFLTADVASGTSNKKNCANSIQSFHRRKRGFQSGVTDGRLPWTITKFEL